MRIVQWLIANKEWVFSGIGVTVLVAILVLFRNQQTRSKVIQHSGDHSALIQGGRDVRIEGHGISHKTETPPGKRG